jgi:hypothetical protein
MEQSSSAYTPWERSSFYTKGETPNYDGSADSLR